ncbi:HAMP domain-containing histidine kinase [Fodinisporobacter ferrooxydans]|uniref:histidine kinase n=1 Tax=Fodinisporobacter ferrooxydans TaxID=2901836 RepID=A0ABY4CLT4_9BACL|nr:HAMP domain-containing histidine kinase [Alicyclobacillaceae bacterium MYW30-H2]
MVNLHGKIEKSCAQDKMGDIRLYRWLRERSCLIGVGIGLIVFGIVFPDWLGPGEIGLDRLLQAAKTYPTGNSLVIVSFVLVLLNTIHALPHYLGAFLIGDVIGERYKRMFLKTAIPIALIPAVYIVINSMQHLKYDFGGPAVLALLSIALLHKFTGNIWRPAMKLLVFSQILIGLQWLDEVPAFTDYGFGRGVISLQVKQLAIQIGFDQAMTVYGIIFCSIFVINAVILTVFLIMSDQRLQFKETLHYAQIEAIESRADREVLQLVHDLKTPLTAIEGLSSLIELYVQESKIKEYCRNISHSIRNMSEMISEILYENRKSWCKLESLINYVRAGRLSGTNASLQMDVPEHLDTLIWVNRIRMTRALVNLIDNAFDAVREQENGTVTLRAQIHTDEIWLGVSDNGPGIPSKEQEKIWQAGYSTKDHPGVGLSFVRQVAEGHGGRVEIDSKTWSGTTIWIKMSRGGNEVENSDRG